MRAWLHLTYFSVAEGQAHSYLQNDRELPPHTPGTEIKRKYILNPETLAPLCYTFAFRGSVSLGKVGAEVGLPNVLQLTVVDGPTLLSFKIELQ